MRLPTPHVVQNGGVNILDIGGKLDLYPFSFHPSPLPEYRHSNQSRAFILTVASDVVHTIRGRQATLVFNCFRYKSSQGQNEWHQY